MDELVACYISFTCVYFTLHCNLYGRPYIIQVVYSDISHLDCKTTNSYVLTLQKNSVCT